MLEWMCPPRLDPAQPFLTSDQVARSQGRGIFLFRKLKDVIDWRKQEPGKRLNIKETCKDGVRLDDQKDDIPVENYVAQRYIENPYLIGGRKFDLRVYVLVMSVREQASLSLHTWQV
ncbi:hypothetical protein lerEdw1_004671 [Lerista edwardsae]|nr:hypothetical protein lerEdw1_004671 [Lerista edwardsae]